MTSASRNMAKAIEQKAKELGAIGYTEAWEEQVTIRFANR